MNPLVIRAIAAITLAFASVNIARSFPLSGLEQAVTDTGFVHQISDCHPQWATHNHSELGGKKKHKHIGVSCKAKAAGGGGGSSSHCHKDTQKHSHPGLGNAKHRHRGSSCKAKAL